MNIEFNSLHWNNVDKRMLDAHKRVMDYFNIPMNYHNLDGLNHGVWMEHVIKTSKCDVIVFFEPDCIPLNNNFIDYIHYAYNNNSFIGIAQVSNHIPPKSHIYAAPAFYVMTKSAYENLGHPSFSETFRSDTAEEICYIAETSGIKYRSLMPTSYEKPSPEGVWALSNLGYYGIGTVFDNSIYHLYQSRFAENIELFLKRCNEILTGKFNATKFISSTSFKI